MDHIFFDFASTLTSVFVHTGSLHSMIAPDTIDSFCLDLFVVKRRRASRLLHKIFLLVGTHIHGAVNFLARACISASSAPDCIHHGDILAIIIQIDIISTCRSLFCYLR